MKRLQIPLCGSFGRNSNTFFAKAQGIVADPRLRRQFLRRKGTRCVRYTLTRFYAHDQHSGGKYKYIFAKAQRTVTDHESSDSF
ncbi:MAG: hypothetical protein H7Y31_16025 [Chitinophagaceae bacterium]|nr:hypothetical protein [Chitinophagaceae bacterium]